MGIRFLYIKKNTHTGVGMQNIVPNEIVNVRNNPEAKSNS